MAVILKRGALPKTPHTEFYAIPGVLALEEIHGSAGFCGAWSRKMHLRSYPTEQQRPPRKAEFKFVGEPSEINAILQPFLIHTGAQPYGGDALRSRIPLAIGHNTRWSILKPTAGFPKDTFFRNGEKHELWYVQEGSGVFHSEFGTLPIRAESYIVVPKGTTYRIELSSAQAWFLLIESTYPIEWPPHYMNSAGQAHMTAPIVETEIEAPELQTAIDERRELLLYVQHAAGNVTAMTLSHHPFDVVGWEGSLYPYVFDIKNHHGIAREIHTAPPMHNTFQSGNVPHNGFSVCSFVPQMEGWHEKEVPAPYAHFNVDSDELMFFCRANYGAREGVIRDGTITFHPGATPHSPHGLGAMKSLVARGKLSSRLAVMMDTYFESMQITAQGWQLCDHEYPTSWFRAVSDGKVSNVP